MAEGCERVAIRLVELALELHLTKNSLSFTRTWMHIKLQVVIAIWCSSNELILPQWHDVLAGLCCPAPLSLRRAERYTLGVPWRLLVSRCRPYVDVIVRLGAPHKSSLRARWGEKSGHPY